MLDEIISHLKYERQLPGGTDKKKLQKLRRTKQKLQQINMVCPRRSGGHIVYAQDTQTQDPLSCEKHCVLKYLTGFNLEENLAFLLKEKLNSYTSCCKCVSGVWQVQVRQVTKCLVCHKSVCLCHNCLSCVLCVCAVCSLQ